MEGPRPAARRIARRRLPRLRVVLLFALVLALGVELLGRGVFCLFIRPILADELPKLRRAGAFRVLCLGDSHTLGIGAEWTTESYPVRLEEALRARHPGRPIAVSRVGISGFNSAQVLIFLRAILEHYPPPDLAIVLVGGNNQYSFWHARFWPDLLRTPTPKNVARYLASHSMLASVAELVYINLRFGRGPGAMGRFLNEYHYLPPRVQADWLAADYAEMIERLRRAGSRVVLLTYPSPRMPVADREAKATAARLGVPCLDLRYFRLSSGQAARLLNPDGHPNAAGYQRMADLVAGFLDARGLLADAPAEAGRATPGGVDGRR